MTYRDIAKAARAQGWIVERRRDANAWYSPDGVTIVVWHRTPSDPRALRNFLSLMRRGGLRYPSSGLQERGE